jgi:hypothetical protein
MGIEAVGKPDGVSLGGDEQMATVYHGESNLV